MLNIALLLYVVAVLIFISGLLVVTYHLLSFRLNRTLAAFIITFMWLGGIVLLFINFFYFSQVDWREVLADFFML